MAVGAGHHSPAVEMEHRIGLVEEHHTVLEAGRHIRVEEMEHHMAVVEEHHTVVEEGHHTVVAADSPLVVVDTDLEEAHHMVVVEDSLAEEDTGPEEAHRKAAVEDSLAEGEGIGHSPAAGNLRRCELVRAHDLRGVTHDLGGGAPYGG